MECFSFRYELILSVNFLLLEFASLGNVFCTSALFYFILFKPQRAANSAAVFPKDLELKVASTFVIGFYYLQPGYWLCLTCLVVSSSLVRTGQYYNEI